MNSILKYQQINGKQWLRVRGGAGQPIWWVGESKKTKKIKCSYNSKIMHSQPYIHEKNRQI